MNLTEAFKALDKLDEEAFSVTADGIEKLQDFTNLDDEIIDVYDVEAKSDKDVNDCHVGDGILDCSICHSKIFKPMAEIVIDEEQQLANVGEECPYCFSVDGYKVVGQVAPMTEDKHVDDCHCEECIERLTEDNVSSLKDSGFDILTIQDVENQNVGGVDDDLLKSMKDQGATILVHNDSMARNWMFKDRTALKDFLDKGGKFGFHNAEKLIEDVEYPGLEFETISDMEKISGYKDDVAHMKELGATVAVTSPQHARTWYFKDLDSAKKYLDSGKKLTYDKAFDIVEESLGSDIKKYQKWIDYDMKRYGKLSDITKQKIERAGLQVVKDQYGDYEVTAGEYKAETLEEKSQLSDIKGTLGNILTKYQDKLNKLESTEDAISFLTSIKDEVKDKKYLDSVIEEVKKLSFAKALSFLYNIILKGDNLSSKLESLEEVEIKADDVEVKIKTSDDEEEIEEKEIVDEQIVPIDDIDIEKIDRETIQAQTEECLKENYKNVNFFRVNNITKRANKFFIEGIVGLRSGKKKNVKMMYEAFKYNDNKVTFLGESAALNIPHNALYLQGKVSDKKLFTESLIKR